MISRKLFRIYDATIHTTVGMLTVFASSASSAALIPIENKETVSRLFSAEQTADKAEVADSLKEVVNFPVSASVLTEESRLRLNRLSLTIDSLSRNDRLEAIDIKGLSSPDGPAPINESLALRRAHTAYDYLSRHSLAPADAYTIRSGGEDWKMLRELVEADSNVPKREKILDIIDSGLSPAEKEQQLKALGKDVWNYLSGNIFPGIRRADITVSWSNHPQIVDTVEFVDTVTEIVTEPEEPETVTTTEEMEMPAENEEEVQQVQIPASHPLNYYIKTNLPAWLCIWTNIEGEADFANHWSVALSLYYSGWNYFRSTTKFRTFSVMPEIRYWVRGDNDGFFAGAHFGMAYYNCALGGDRRYQDHDGTTPALGGGISAGYRLPLRNPHWKLEFSIGAGVYHLDYDIFDNRHNGQLLDREKRTFFGLDKVAVSLCYTFGRGKQIRKGGGK